MYISAGLAIGWRWQGPQLGVKAVDKLPESELSRLTTKTNESVSQKAPVFACLPAKRVANIGIGQTKNAKVASNGFPQVGATLVARDSGYFT